MSRYRLSVCKGPDCRRNGSERVLVAARRGIPSLGLTEKCTLIRGGCYGLCHLGPNVVVRPEANRPRDLFCQEDFQLMGWEGEVHYAEMTAEKMERVLREHIGEDLPVQALQGARED